MKNLVKSFFLLIVVTAFLSACGYKNSNCTSCNGTGKSNCSWCYGEGSVKCNSCYGSGKETKYGYGYDYKNGGEYHYFYGEFPCSKCNQSGKINCTNVSCHNGKITCSWCNGTGKKDNEEYGFFSGIKDGFLVIFAWINKFFNSDITVYAVNNSGMFYWFGFILGVLFSLGVIGGSSKN